MSKGAAISVDNENDESLLNDLSHSSEIKVIQEQMDAIISPEKFSHVHEDKHKIDFEKLALLSKLDSLSELENLEQLSKLENLSLLSGLEDLQHLKRLDKLEKLDSLGSLEKLDELSKLDKLQKLSHLDQLKELNQLIELNKLQELVHLRNLTSLKELSHLDKISELSKLEVIGKLENALHHHKDVLIPLKKLDHLDKLEHLSNLVMMEKLGDLKNLNELDKLVLLKKLDELQNLSSLSELDNLKSLRRLDEMQNLEQLKKLQELQNLVKLDELKSLNHLEKLTQLEKLDRIDDARFAERLERLDKLDILKTESKKLVFQQLVGFILDVFKFVIAGFCILMVMTTERGQQVTSKILPAIGFGNSAQTSLALQMLVGQLKEDEFEEIIQQTRKKMEFEINSVFSNDSVISPYRRLELLRQAKGYSFSSNGVDLGHEAELRIKEKVQRLEVESVESIDYAIGLSKSESNIEKERFLREVKILLMNRKYVELLEKTLPRWNSGREMVKASLIALYYLELETPDVLDEILGRPTISRPKGDL